MARGFFEALEWLSTWMKENYNLNISLSISSTQYLIEKEAQIVAFDSIRELLFNVVKHAGVTNATLKYENENNKIVITVEDKGVGFDLKETLSGQQFGLLYIIRRIELIGGNISIYTDENKGTKIVLTFPMESHNNLKSTQPIRVLLVDDHAIVREGIRFILEQQADISVIGEASNISEVLELIQRRKPDIILMDISLGENKPNGIEVTKILRQKGFKQNIVALSSYDLPHYRKSMKDLGISDFLIKGDDTNKVIESIRKSAQEVI
jgi:CheY-like chemotaxis protein